MMLLLVTLVAFARLATCHKHQLRSLEERQATTSSAYDGPTVPEFNISVPVDHFNQSDTRVYNNRYWVNDTYYEPGGPVFYFDFGESGVSDYQAALWLAELNGTTAVMALARQYNGLAVIWEHRYYGYSLPIPFNSSNTYQDIGPIDQPQGWEYLTVDQALEDVVYFAQNMATGGYQRDNMTALAPSNTPWIWIGGSYPGERGAWARIRNPEVIYATWSSSAVPEVKYDGSDYFDEAERSLPSNCSTDLRAMVTYVDGILSGDPLSQEYMDIQKYMYIVQVIGLSSLYANQSDAYTYNLSFAQSWDTFTIGSTMASAIFGQSQTFGPVLTNDIFCNFFESFDPTAEGNVTIDKYVSAATNPGNAQPAAEGIIASNNGNLTIGLQALTYALTQFQIYNLVNLTRLVNYDDANPPYFLQDSASWSYQVETQLGWFQGSNPDNVTFISKYLNYTAVQHIGYTYTFSQATIDSLPAEPDLASVLKYGGWNMNPTNVMFTAGESDPWRAGGLFSRELGSPGNQPTDNIPACGTSPENGTRYGTVYPGAAHVWDLRYTPWAEQLSNDSQGRSPLEAGLEMFTAALDVWLPCFNGTSSGGGNVTRPTPYTGQASSRRSPIWMVLVASLSAVLGIMVM